MATENSEKKELQNPTPPNEGNSTVTPVIMGSPSTNLLKRHRKTLLALGLILLVAAVGAVLYLGTKDEDKPHKVVCDDSMMSKASSVLTTDKVSELQPIADEIQNLPDYDKDANCLNIVTTYYIHISDYTNARFHIDMLKMLVEDGHTFSEKLGSDAKRMEELDMTVDFLEEQEARRQEGQGVIPTQKVEQ